MSGARDGRGAGARPGPAGDGPDETKLPETAENFEHTIRRLVIERERRRSEGPAIARSD